MRIPDGDCSDGGQSYDLTPDPGTDAPPPGEACPTCGGVGWVETNDADHAPGCDGNCGSDCPVMVQGQIACHDCGGTGSPAEVFVTNERKP